MARSVETTYTLDHLAKAYDITASDFWETYKALGHPLDNRVEQHKLIQELVRLGNSMIKISEAKQAVY